MEEFNALKKDITLDMENYRFYMASEKIYHYFWHTFADVIIEKSKKDASLKPLLRPLLEQQLKLLHPFMPFITEEVWSLLGHDSLLMIEKWPE